MASQLSLQTHGLYRTECRGKEVRCSGWSGSALMTLPKESLVQKLQDPAPVRYIKKHENENKHFKLNHFDYCLKKTDYM